MKILIFFIQNNDLIYSSCINNHKIKNDILFYTTISCNKYCSINILTIYSYEEALQILGFRIFFRALKFFFQKKKKNFQSNSKLRMQLRIINNGKELKKCSCT